jgi:hypothetical protein
VELDWHLCPIPNPVCGLLRRPLAVFVDELGQPRGDHRPVQRVHDVYEIETTARRLCQDAASVCDPPPYGGQVDTGDYN